MTYIYRILLLVVFAVLAAPLYALTVNLLIAFEIFESTQVTYSLGETMTLKSTYIWMGSLIIGIIGIFMPPKIYMYFFTVPLIAPSLFAIIYTLSL